MTWTVLDLKRIPPTTRCCQHCNPVLVDAYSASNVHDERIKKFAPDFLFPIVPPHSRPSSSLSMRSAVSSSSTFVPISSGYKVPVEEKERLRSQLIQWREKMHVLRGSPLFFSSQIFLPPKQLNLLVSECNKYLEVPIVDSRFLRRLIQWESAGEAEWNEVSQLIMEWREDARPPATPTSQRRARKKVRAPVEGPRTLMMQPNFPALHVAPRFMSTLQSETFPASDVFQTSQSATRQSYVSRTLTTTSRPKRSNVYHPQVTHPNALSTEPIPSPSIHPNIYPLQPIPSPSSIQTNPYPSPSIHPNIFPLHSNPSPSSIQTNPYYQLITPQPAVYPQTPILPVPYNQSYPGTIIYQTPTAPPSSLRFSSYNSQIPHKHLR